MQINQTEVSYVAISLVDHNFVDYNYIVMHNKKIDDWHHSSEAVACFDSEEKAIDFVTESNYYDRNVKGFDWFSFVAVEVN